jgi:hypothetical protein
LAQEWLASELPELEVQDVARALYQHVETGGEIGERPEQRPEYAHYEFHYDLRVKIGGRRICFETVLKVLGNPDDPDDPTSLSTAAQPTHHGGARRVSEGL